MFLIIRSYEYSKEVIINSSILFMPIEPFFGNALGKCKVVFDFVDAYLKALFKPTQFHFNNRMLFIEIEANWFNKLKNRKRLI